MAMRQIVQADLFNQTEMDAIFRAHTEYKAVAQTYIGGGSVGITPHVLTELSNRCVDRQMNVADVKRYMTIFSFMCNQPIAPPYVLLDEETKRLYMLITMVG